MSTNPEAQISVDAARAALRDVEKNKRALAERIREGKAKIHQVCGGRDLSQIAAVDPKRAREVAAELGMIQSQLQIDTILHDTIDSKAADFGLIVLTDSLRIIEHIGRLAAANVELVETNVRARIKALGFYEDARLPRLVEEALPVRAERHHNMTIEPQLGCGGGEAFPIGDGGSYYPNWQSEHVLIAHERLVGIAEEMETRSSELKKRYRQ